MAGVVHIEEFRARADNFLAAMPTEVLRINRGLAASVIPLITGRIINEGKDAKGQLFGSYSDNPLPLFFYKNKATGKVSEDSFNSLVKAKKKVLSTGEKFKGVSYKEFRQLGNLPTNFVTMSFTGETLADVGIKDEKIEGSLVRTTIASTNKHTKAKYNAKGQKVGEDGTEKILDFLGERYGENILEPNPEELEILQAAFEDELQQVLDKFFK